MSANQTIHPTQTQARNLCANTMLPEPSPASPGLELHPSQSDSCGLHCCWRPSISRPPDLGSTPTPRQQRCGRCSLLLQNGGYTASGLQHGQQYPQHCPIGQCWGKKPEPPQDDLPCPEAVHALSVRHSRNMRAKHGVATSDDVSRIRDLSSSDVIVRPDWPHGFLPVCQPASDTVRPRGNRLQLFQALS
jgi:hypothetical protein